MGILARAQKIVSQWIRAQVPIQKEKSGPTGGRSYGKKKKRKAQKAARRKNRR